MIKEDWLRSRYVDDLASLGDIAKEAGCSTHNISRLLHKWGIRRGKAAVLGKPAWNSGLTKHDDVRIAKLALDRVGEGNPMYGKDVWNKGLTKDNDERVAAIAEKGRHRVVSEETRKKLADAKRGKFGKDACNYKIGKHLNAAGYWTVSHGSEKKYEHRMIFENYLGRELGVDEFVHHLDGVKSNNDCENLILLSNSSHLKLHRYCFPESKEVQLEWLEQNNVDFVEINKHESERCVAGNKWDVCTLGADVMGDH